MFVAPSEAIWCSSYLLEVVWIVVARSEVTWLFSCLLVLFGNLLGSFVAPGEAVLVSSCLLEFVWDRWLLVFNG